MCSCEWTWAKKRPKTRRIKRKTTKTRWKIGVIFYLVDFSLVLLLIRGVDNPSTKSIVKSMDWNQEVWSKIESVCLYTLYVRDVALNTRWGKNDPNAHKFCWIFSCLGFYHRRYIDRKCKRIRVWEDGDRGNKAKVTNITLFILFRFLFYSISLFHFMHLIGFCANNH